MNVTGIDHKVKAIKEGLREGRIVYIYARHVRDSYCVEDVLWRDGWSSIGLKVRQENWSGTVTVDLSDIVMVAVLDHA